MADVELKCLRSAAELRAIAPAWDELWQRSDVALPTLRAELLAQWFEQFAPSAALCLLVVQQEGKLLAALPLYESRRRRVRIGTLPNNEWSPAGDLLLDPACDHSKVLDKLVESLSQADWPLTWLTDIPLSTPRWQAFVAAVQRRGLQYTSVERCQVGQIEITGDWDAYFAARTRNHRHHVRQASNRADREGPVELATCNRLDPQQPGRSLRAGFELEDRGWKGESHGSVLSCPSIFAFYQRQAELLEPLGQLQLSFLECQGRAIAFEYGWISKGTYFSPKVAYDEEFDRLSPGQLLRSKIVEQFFCRPEITTVDFLGELTDATARWATRSYPISDLIIATPSLSGRLLLHAYSRWWPRLKRLRKKFSAVRA